MDVLPKDRIVLDPSRIAAQVVSGIGFIGGGVIFMRRDVVRGLTTAASVWLTAALGLACGAGLPLLALATTGGHFVIMLGFPALMRRLPLGRWVATEVRISYQDGRGLLPIILICCTELRFVINHVRLGREHHPIVSGDAEDLAASENPGPRRKGTVTLRMRVRGKRPVSHLIAALSDIAGVNEVGIADDDEELD